MTPFWFLFVLLNFVLYWVLVTFPTRGVKIIGGVSLSQRWSKQKPSKRSCCWDWDWEDWGKKLPLSQKGFNVVWRDGRRKWGRRVLRRIVTYNTSYIRKLLLSPFAFLIIYLINFFWYRRQSLKSLQPFWVDSSSSDNPNLFEELPGETSLDPGYRTRLFSIWHSFLSNLTRHMTSDLTVHTKSKKDLLTPSKHDHLQIVSGEVIVVVGLLCFMRFWD